MHTVHFGDSFEIISHRPLLRQSLIPGNTVGSTVMNDSNSYI